MPGGKINYECLAVAAASNALPALPVRFIGGLWITKIIDALPEWLFNGGYAE
jgi:hypothetical protein